MANRLVSVDDNLNLPPAVQEQLVGEVRAEFIAYSTTAQAAASTATNDAAVASEMAGRAEAAAAAAEAPTDAQVDAGIDRAVEQDRLLSERNLMTLAIEAVEDPNAIRGEAGVKQTIPTHISPSGGETTHPSVVFIPEGWNGYRYWMAHTPYPGGNDDHEDPNICASNDGINWVVPPGLVNPLDDADGQPEYNSDTDLAMGPDGLYLFWRYYDPAMVGQEEQMFYRKSTDGVTWTPKVRYWATSETVYRLMSPSMIYKDQRWHMWAVNILPSPNQVVYVVNDSMDPADTSWSTPDPVTVAPIQAGKEPWHIEIIEYGGRYMGILSDCTQDVSGTNGDLLFIVGATPTSFTASASPIIPRSGGSGGATHTALYRATLIPGFRNDKFGFRVWYAGWTQSPVVWNIFYTWVSAQSSAYGTFLSAAIAANATVTVPITFPAGRFTTPPVLTVSTNNSRATIATNNITTTGADIIISNWTSGAIPLNTPFWWQASPRSLG